MFYNRIMLLPRDRLLNLPIMSLQTGTQIGTAISHIVDPRRLNVVAFYCEGQLINFNPAILHVADIRELSSIGLIVDSADNIMPPDDLVRLKEILDYHFELEGKQVVEEGGHKLGKVGGYTVDSESFYIVKLHVKPTLLQSFGRAELLIDRTQISEINDKQIVVRRATVRDEKRAPFASIPAIDNPFRKAPHGMPEAHSSHKKKEATEDAHGAQ
jgi:sporulation protein YlmC with PRC-barrel domain